MTVSDIRASFLKFFSVKGFSILPSASVVPDNDPTVLFNTAGMQPLVPNLLGTPHPKGTRLANSQKCIRTNDIDEVGDYSHLTFFEMLGHWSLGDYWKEEALNWLWEWLTSSDQLGLDPDKLFVTVYRGDEHIDEDAEALKIWQTIFERANLSFEGRYLKLGRDDNWWEIGGVDTSPAGPSSEVFYYLGDEQNPKFNADSTDFIEIGNTVFMEYQRDEDGNYHQLAQKNIDFGGGLERLAMVANHEASVYGIDIFSKLTSTIENYATENYRTVFQETNPDSSGRAVRIIADHMRTAAVMAADNVVPSNVGAGYVMRRLCRRAIREGLVIGITKNLLSTIAPTVIDEYKTAYAEFESNQNQIIKVLSSEEENFRKTLERGLREFEKLSQTQLFGETLFKLYDTYGFPKELSLEEAKRRNIKIEANATNEFHKLMDEQRSRSRTASVGQFKGGLADDSTISTRYHTATHLLYRALRNVLGDHVTQRGSNITQERTRFDFSHHSKLSPEQIKQVEDMVNDVIERDLPVSCVQLPVKQALTSGAIGAFGDKYGEEVTVYTVGDPQGDWYSREICGGPHVSRTSEIGKFKIIKEESSSAGVRRIKAVIS